MPPSRLASRSSSSAFSSCSSPYASRTRTFSDAARCISSRCCSAFRRASSTSLVSSSSTASRHATSSASASLSARSASIWLRCLRVRLYTAVITSAKSEGSTQLNRLRATLASFCSTKRSCSLKRRDCSSTTVWLWAAIDSRSCAARTVSFATWARWSSPAEEAAWPPLALPIDSSASPMKLPPSSSLLSSWAPGASGSCSRSTSMCRSIAWSSCTHATREAIRASRICSRSAIWLSRHTASDTQRSTSCLLPGGASRASPPHSTLPDNASSRARRLAAAAVLRASTACSCSMRACFSAGSHERSPATSETAFGSSSVRFHAPLGSLLLMELSIDSSPGASGCQASSAAAESSRPPSHPCRAPLLRLVCMPPASAIAGHREPEGGGLSAPMAVRRRGVLAIGGVKLSPASGLVAGLSSPSARVNSGLRQPSSPPPARAGLLSWAASSLRESSSACSSAFFDSATVALSRHRSRSSCSAFSCCCAAASRR
mmetsp:Transcript_5604/g.14345  ORF Transcript_5604/g.14345 Transcript_5604/m.14345 type:complete len:489 (-) Transcript_5604:133-1599(-)